MTERSSAASSSWKLAACLTATLALTAGGLFALQDESAEANPAEPKTEKPSGPEEARGQLEQRLETLAERLELSAEQQQQVRPIIEGQVTRLQALRDEYRARGPRRKGRRQLRKQFAEVRKETDEQMAQILSAEQMEEYAKLQQEIRQKMRKRRGKKAQPKPEAAEPSQEGGGL